MTIPLRRFLTTCALIMTGLIVLTASLLVAVRVYLDDARLTDVANAKMSELIAGSFEIQRVHWGLPMILQVENLTIKSPGGLPVVRLAHLEAELLLPQIFLGRAVVDHVTLESLRIDLVLPPGQNKTSALLAALQPQFELPPLDKVHVPVRVEVRHMTVAEAEFAVTGKPHLRARIRNLAVEDAEVWMQKEMAGATLTISAGAFLRNTGVDVKIPNLRIKVDDARFRFSTFEGWLQRLGVTLPGIDFDLAGYAMADSEGLQAAQGRGNLRINTEDATLREQIPTELRAGLRGSATLAFSGQVQNQNGFVELDLQEKRFEVRAIPIKALHMKGMLKGNQALAEAFKIDLADGYLEAHGTAFVPKSGDPLLGAHQISIKAHSLPVRALAGQFVGLPELLPVSLSFAATSSGRALWPPTSQFDLDIVPEGLPGEDWPGLPRTMEVSARIMTHPDLLEILKLEVSIDKIPEFGIQGALPMQKQSLIDLVEELHSAHPAGPLRRIPVAPARPAARSAKR